MLIEKPIWVTQRNTSSGSQSTSWKSTSLQKHHFELQCLCTGSWSWFRDGSYVV